MQDNEIPYRIKDCFYMMGIIEDFNREHAKRVYNQIYNKYVAEQISIDKYYDVELAFEEITEYFDDLEIIKMRERNRKMFEIKMATEKLKREIEAKLREEQRKGILWTVLEGLKNEEINLAFDDYLKYIKNVILENLDLELHEKYNNFF